MDEGGWLEIIRKSLTRFNHKLEPGRPQPLAEFEKPQPTAPYKLYLCLLKPLQLVQIKYQGKVIGKENQKFDEVQS